MAPHSIDTIVSYFVYVRYYYVFGTGVKSGELNYLVYKGVVFKTYEGKLIQSGFRADKPGDYNPTSSTSR